MTTPPLLTRAFALACAVLVTAAGVAVATVPGDAALPEDAVAARRFDGNDRYATAALTALAAFPDGAQTAVVARGDQFPDGLAASYLAGVEEAPILLTKPDELPLATQDAFDELGTERVVVIGGPSAINDRVEERLVELFGEDGVDRIGGQDRFYTASLIFNETDELGTLRDASGESDAELTTAIVASGRTFPDALAAGPLANAAHLPILLTEPDELPDITRFALESGVEQVLVVGGPVTISEDVLTEIGTIDGIQVVQRISGPDRTATAVALADLTRDQLGWAHEGAALALGTDFPDALSLAPTAAALRAPILLTRSTSEVGTSTFVALQSDCDTLADLRISGGRVAVDAGTERQAELATSCADQVIELTGEAEVADGETGAGDLDATGTAWLWVDELCYAVRTRGLSAPAIAAHIHAGDAGTNGGIAATLDVPSPPDGDGLAVGCLTDDDVNDGTADELRSAIAEDPAGFYVNVHTDDFPTGAVRGQLAEG